MAVALKETDGWAITSAPLSSTKPKKTVETIALYRYADTK